MNKFFETLSFKQKIVTGFGAISSILILGMSFMLLEFTNIASLSTGIIEQQQPVTNAANKAAIYAQSARNQIQKFTLTDGKESLEDYPTVLKLLSVEIQVLEQYAKHSEMLIDLQKLDRSKVIIEEIKQVSAEIVELNHNYEQNHPIITAASSLLNPPALEYLGLINQIMEDYVAEGLPTEGLVLLAEIRHSYTQITSHVRIALATQSLGQLINLNAYVDVNKESTERLKSMGLDLGFDGIEKLEQIREGFLVDLDTITQMFKTSIWRRDTHIMATRMIPLYDELMSYLGEIAKIQLVNTKKASVDLASELLFVRYAFIALIITSFAFAFLFSVFITRSLRRPLQKLATATEAVANGNLDIKIDTSGNDEIAHLNNSFNNMVKDLRKTHAELTNAMQEAKQASEAKTHFVSSISHELRTPLNAILGFAQLYEFSANLTEQQKENARKIYRAGEHLLSLINGVLNLTRVEAGKLELSMEPVSLTIILEDCLSIAAPLAESEGIILNTSFVNYEDKYVFADRTRLEQVILNLVSNAIKYNKKEGAVTISCTDGENDTVRISVSDTGPGIAQDKLSEIFQAFNRIGAEKSEVEGTGLGLMITKQLVELMGGKLDVESIEEQGSTFWIEFDSCEAGTPETHVEVIEKESSTHDSGLLSNSNARILIAEDNEFNQDVLQQQLSVLGYSAEFANNGIEALEKWQTGNYQLLLTDIQMPEMDGFELVDKIRQEEQRGDLRIPIIAITANAMDGEAEHCLESGMDAYVSKPVNLDALRLVMEKWLPEQVEDNN